MREMRGSQTKILSTVVIVVINGRFSEKNSPVSEKGIRNLIGGEKRDYISREKERQTGHWMTRGQRAKGETK
jgi:hypothetical protein